MYISHFITVYLNIFQVQTSSKKNSWQSIYRIIGHHWIWTAVTNNTATELVSSEAQCSTAWTSRWWWATEWISVIWHSSTGEVCRTVSVSHMSAQWVWCNRVWRSTFLHAGHVVLSWTWKTLMVKTITCISSRVLPWKQVSVALTKTVDVSWKASKRSSQDR